MSVYQHLQAARLVSARNLDAAIASYQQLHSNNDSSAADMLALSLWWRGRHDDAIALIGNPQPEQASRAACEIMCNHLLSAQADNLEKAEPFVQRLASMPENPSLSDITSNLGWLARQISPAHQEGRFVTRVRTGLDAFVEARRHSVKWARLWLAAEYAQRIQLTPPVP